jgi:hypothetical protein
LQFVEECGVRLEPELRDLRAEDSSGGRTIPKVSSCYV